MPFYLSSCTPSLRLRLRLGLGLPLASFSSSSSSAAATPRTLSLGTRFGASVGSGIGTRSKTTSTAIKTAATTASTTTTSSLWLSRLGPRAGIHGIANNVGNNINSVRTMATQTGVTAEGIERALRENLAATHVEVDDISGGCGQSFAAVIVSPRFEGKATLARHRLVNGALRNEIAAIHAWTPRCFTPKQWEERQ